MIMIKYTIQIGKNSWSSKTEALLNLINYQPDIDRKKIIWKWRQLIYPKVFIKFSIAMNNVH